MFGSKPNIYWYDFYLRVVGIWDDVMIIKHFLIGKIITFGDDSYCVYIHIFVAASSILRYLFLYFIHQILEIAHHKLHVSFFFVS